MSKEELKDLFENFLNEKGLYFYFISWLEMRDEDPNELGFEG